MTERLYYRDPSKVEFDATVVAASGVDPDGRSRVRLDCTAFYPTSGGQPFDTGTLGGASVVDVIDDDDAADTPDVIHVVAGAAPRPGERVRGFIDWTRRFDHMQQHTGQHVLSAAFAALVDAPTVGFHMGAEISTIDLARDVSPAQIAAAEDAANRVAWEDRPIAVRFVTESEAAALPLRKPPKKSGTIRLIDIEGWDLSACGGTHVARTGMIGTIGVSAWERFKGGTRVEFVCGGHALARMRALRDASSAAARALSVPWTELASSIERMSAEAKEHRRTMAGLQHELAVHRAAAMAAEAVAMPHGHLVLRAVDGDAASLKALAAALAAHAGVAAVLVSTTSPALVVAARAADLPLRANELVASLTAAFGGRGGGKPDMAQAGGLNASAETILAEAQRLIGR